MQEKVQRLIHTFAALADLGQEIADPHDFLEMIRTSLHLLLGTLAIRRGAVAEYNKEDHVLHFVAARGLGDEPPADLPLDSEDVEGLLSLGLCGLAMNDETPAFAHFAARHQAFFAESRIELVVPLVVRNDLTGIVLLGGKASNESFTADDRDVVCSMARHIGVGIHTHRLLEELERRAEENRQLYEGLRAIYKDTVRAFAAAIDIKDKYTQGHSERVGKYSEIIAREMGWSDEEVEGIAIAGYLHDIGKLIVERDIINAPYKIDAKKSSELNRHPAAGYEILAPIRHPYADIPLMARHHHERIDGRGYPDGLTGDQIPIGTKIITLADSFDAMTTNRPYKTRRSLEEVVEDFRRNTGKQFDVDVVISFCRALVREFKGETKARAITKILGKDYVDPARITPLLEELIVELESAARPQQEEIASAVSSES
ncbi:MAG TPA: HD domain-containing phosphohydrolase [Pyrinomonadaceae bacterium]|jgi:response regulator RpfG family c-di-GMP phosphodiesterase|nr:HD domain-containing phosphohydrolase [Pyrinomonadaceae bacterium]